MSLNDSVVLLDFVYTGQLKLTKQMIWDMTSMAAILNMPDTLKLCHDFVEIYGGLVSQKVNFVF